MLKLNPSSIKLTAMMTNPKIKRKVLKVPPRLMMRNNQPKKVKDKKLKTLMKRNPKRAPLYP